MAKSLAQLSYRGSEANPSGWEEVVHITGSALDPNDFNLDVEVRAMFQEAWNTKTCSDITLCAGDSEFKAHKLLLAAHSSFFRQKLGESRVTVDLEPDVLKLVFTFLYTGGVEMPKSSIPQVQAAADLLNIPVLQKLCLCAALTDQEVTKHNCLQMWEAGSKVKNEQLATKGLDFALKHPAQYSTHFLKLPHECLKEYILHNDLQALTPDAKLSAALRWALHDPETRLQHLAEVMNHLPMSKMQPWLLQDTLHNPLITDNRDVCRILEDTLKVQSEGGKEKKAVSLQEMKSVPPPQPAPAAQSQGELCVVTVGHQVYRDGKRQAPSDDVILCRVGQDIKVETVGKLGASHIPLGTKSVVDGRSLYVGGVGKNADELWKYGLDERSPATGSLLSRFTSPRQFHAMCYKDGQIYILGGLEGGVNCTASVEVFDPQKGSCTNIGQLQHYIIINSGGYRTNLTCHGLDNDDCIIVCGAYPTDDKGKTLKYQHSIQLFCPSRGVVTSSVTLGKVSERSVYSIVPVDANNFIVLARDYTAVISKQHIEQNQPHKCTYADRYVVPNAWCGVAVTASRQYVLLLGGAAKQFSPEHYCYRARVTDILANTGPGWEKMQANWPLGKCMIYMSNTMDAVKY